MEKPGGILTAVADARQPVARTEETILPRLHDGGKQADKIVGREKLPWEAVQRMAEREGFEPSVHLLGVHTISNRAPSANSDISPRKLCFYNDPLRVSRTIHSFTPHGGRQKGISSPHVVPKGRTNLRAAEARPSWNLLPPGCPASSSPVRQSQSCTAYFRPDLPNPESEVSLPRRLGNLSSDTDRRSPRAYPMPPPGATRFAPACSRLCLSTPHWWLP